MKIKTGLTYDDVLLVPKYSEIESRSDVDLSVDLGKGIVLDIPIVSANMNTITGWKMARAIAMEGGLALIHRFNSIQEQVTEYTTATQGLNDLRNHIGISVGIKEEDFERVDTLCGKYGCRICVIDVAHGHHENCGLMVDYIHRTFPNVLLIAGNVATLAGSLFLAGRGADVIKLGVGNGSLCSTRIETGNGVPSITMLDEVHEHRAKVVAYLGQYPFKIIADGGLRTAGDITKALCFADAVMLGSLFAGTDETPGESFGIDSIDGIRYKEYNGSSTLKANHVEGVKVKVACKGPVKYVIDSLLEGVRSGCSYQGVSNLNDLKKDPEWNTITNSGLIESHPHNKYYK